MYFKKTGEKPFKCDECKRLFLTKGHLTSHQLTHSREKPFTCQTCNKGYSRASRLQINERTHVRIISVGYKTL